MAELMGNQQMLAALVVELVLAWCAWRVWKKFIGRLAACKLEAEKRLAARQLEAERRLLADAVVHIAVFMTEKQARQRATGAAILSGGVDE